MRKFFILLWLLSLTLGGCRQRGAPILLSPRPTGADSSDVSASPVLATPVLTSLTPEPGTAIVMGTILWEGTSNVPAIDVDLYLTEVSEVEEGGMSLAKLDPASSPKATIDETGTFVFTDIPPGRYALAASISPANSVLIPDPETGKELIISVRAGEVVDLGIVYVPSLW